MVVDCILNQKFRILDTAVVLLAFSLYEQHGAFWVLVCAMLKKHNMDAMRGHNII